MCSNNVGKAVEILLVEDNPGDVHLTREALKECKFNNNLTVVKDGVEAINYLQHKGKYANTTSPDLILLDLYLPKMNGQEVLSEIKQDPMLMNIPVVVLTVSNAEQDILKTYDLRANDYITKPIDLDQFTWAMKLLGDFWFNLLEDHPDEHGKSNNNTMLNQ